VKHAISADRYQIENANTPSESSLPRADRDAMAEFIANLRMVLGTLGYPILEPLLKLTSVTAASTATSEDTKMPRGRSSVDLTFRVNNLIAHATQTDEGFVVLKGSHLSFSNTDSAAQRVINLKKQLIADGRAVQDGDHYVLQDDVLLSSSSYAAVLVAGTARSGPQSWIASDGRSLKALEESEVVERPPKFPLVSDTALT
jgi:hypothetical protein